MNAHLRKLLRGLVTLFVIFVVCTLLAVIFAGSTYADYAYRKIELNPWDALSLALADWWPWVVLAPLILWLTPRLPFERGRWLLALAVHLPLSLVCAMTKTLMKVGALVVLISAEPDQARASVGDLARAVLSYWVFVALLQGVEFYRRYRQRELRATQLQAQLDRARLQVLRMQLNPHFLFNTLHAISTLMHRDVDAADRMMSRLSDFLRLTLETDGDQLVPLRQELDVLGKYFEIESIRFGDRLEIDMAVDPATLDAAVPNLMLQPLAENAVRHGISRRQASGRITVSASRDNGRLILQVQDDGPGPGKSDTENENETPAGIGLSNTRARLHQLYGDRQRFDLDAVSGGGTVARVTIPYEPMSEGDRT